MSSFDEKISRESSENRGGVYKIDTHPRGSEIPVDTRPPDKLEDIKIGSLRTRSWDYYLDQKVLSSLSSPLSIPAFMTSYLAAHTPGYFISTIRRSNLLPEGILGSWRNSTAGQVFANEYIKIQLREWLPPLVRDQVEWHCFKPDGPPSSRGRIANLEDLERSLKRYTTDRQRFLATFKPIFNLQRGSQLSVEIEAAWMIYSRFNQISSEVGGLFSFTLEDAKKYVQGGHGAEIERKIISLRREILNFSPEFKEAGYDPKKLRKFLDEMALDRAGLLDSLYKEAGAYEGNFRFYGLHYDTLPSALSLLHLLGVLPVITEVQEFLGIWQRQDANTNIVDYGFHLATFFSSFGLALKSSQSLYYQSQLYYSTTTLTQLRAALGAHQASHAAWFFAGMHMSLTGLKNFHQDLKRERPVGGSLLQVGAGIASFPTPAYRRAVLRSGMDLSKTTSFLSKQGLKLLFENAARRFWLTFLAYEAGSYIRRQQDSLEEAEDLAVAIDDKVSQLVRQPVNNIWSGRLKQQMESSRFDEQVALIVIRKAEAFNQLIETFKPGFKEYHKALFNALGEGDSLLSDLTPEVKAYRAILGFFIGGNQSEGPLYLDLALKDMATDKEAQAKYELYVKKMYNKCEGYCIPSSFSELMAYKGVPLERNSFTGEGYPGLKLPE